MNAKSFLYGLIIGGTAAGAAVLFSTPASGETTRRRLLKNKDQLGSQCQLLKKQLNDIKNAAITLSTDGKETVSSISKDLKTTLADWKNEVRPHQQSLQLELKAIESAIGNLEAALNKDNNRLDELEKV